MCLDLVLSISILRIFTGLIHYMQNADLSLGTLAKDTMLLSREALQQCRGWHQCGCMIFGTQRRSKCRKKMQKLFQICFNVLLVIGALHKDNTVNLLQSFADLWHWVLQTSSNNKVESAHVILLNITLLFMYQRTTNTVMQIQ